MNQEKRIDIQKLVSHPEFWTLNTMLHEAIEDLDRCSNIDETKDIAAQALGRKYAKEILSKLLTDMGIALRKPINKDATYE